jgi:hypothetical protein
MTEKSIKHSPAEQYLIDNYKLTEIGGLRINGKPWTEIMEEFAVMYLRSERKKMHEMLPSEEDLIKLLYSVREVKRESSEGVEVHWPFKAQAEIIQKRLKQILYDLTDDNNVCDWPLCFCPGKDFCITEKPNDDCTISNRPPESKL